MFIVLALMFILLALLLLDAMEIAPIKGIFLRGLVSYGVFIHH